MRKPIHPITIADTEKLGVDDDGKLYWNDVPVKTENEVRLSVWVNVAILITAAATVIQAICAIKALK